MSRVKIYPYWLMTPEVREKNRESIMCGYKKGRQCWKKGKKDARHAEVMKEKFESGEWEPPSKGLLNEKHHNWTGDKVGYAGLHKWLAKYKTRPKYCEHCKTTKPKRFEWANIDGKYSRNLEDYINLCTKCHGIHDAKLRKIKKSKLYEQS